MTQVHAFAVHTIVLAFVMTTAHYAVVWIINRRRAATGAERQSVPALEHVPWDVIDGGILMPLDAPSDYRNSVLPDQEAAHEGWIEKARVEARRIAKERGCLTSDDIWDVCPPPPGVDPRVMGAIFADKTLWERTGYTKSSRKINHGRVVAQWKLREAA